MYGRRLELQLYLVSFKIDDKRTQEPLLLSEVQYLVHKNIQILLLGGGGSRRDSKPGRFFPNPGFGFGRPQTRVSGSGSGFATLKSRRQVDDV